MKLIPAGLSLSPLSLNGDFFGRSRSVEKGTNYMNLRRVQCCRPVFAPAANLGNPSSKSRSPALDVCVASACTRRFWRSQPANVNGLTSPPLQTPPASSRSSRTPPSSPPFPTRPQSAAHSRLTRPQRFELTGPSRQVHLHAPLLADLVRAGRSNVAVTQVPICIFNAGFRGNQAAALFTGGHSYSILVSNRAAWCTLLRLPQPRHPR
jgi:hypothetical protein